jgi:hypothetical protein
LLNKDDNIYTVSAWHPENGLILVDANITKGLKQINEYGRMRYNKQIKGK